MRRGLLRLFFMVLGWACVPAGPLHAQVTISEFQAANSRTLQDDDGDYSDWIELRRIGSDGAALERKAIDGVQAGSAVFPARWGLGSYEFTLFRAHRSSPGLVARSNPFSLVAGR